MSSSDLFSREEALGGLNARRAHTLLFLIESRAAHLAAQSQQALNPFLTAEGERQRDLVFFEAFALGREPPLRPTIQDLERHAPEWRILVPDNAELRAVLARGLGDKYQFTYSSVPQLRAALGLEDLSVQHAFERRYGKSLHSIYRPHGTWSERLRWAVTAFANRLETLPPFWTAYSLTLTDTVGGGILALPIALATIGPLPGLALLLLLGLANVLTMAAMAESVARTGSIRYGNAFFGRLVSEYLGRAGSWVLTLALAGMNLTSLLGYYIGISSTLANITVLRAEIWTVLLFVIGLYFLSRGSLSSTIASALVVGAINIVMVLVLTLLAAPQIRPENLTYVNVPFLNGQPFEPSILELIFGIVLLAYFGHSSVGNCGKLVLRRDPSGRSLIGGTVAAQISAIFLYCVWVLAINGAITPQALAAEKGTALAPLAAAVGPAVNVFGLVLVVLGMGMTSIHSSLGLFNLVQERLPEPSRPVLLLPRRRGRLLLRPRRSHDGPRLALTYLGMQEDQAQFALDRQSDGHTERHTIAFKTCWEEAQTKTRLDVLDLSAEHVRLKIASALAVTYEEHPEVVGVQLLDALQTSEPESPLIPWMLRRGQSTLSEVAAYLHKDPDSARAQLNRLIENGSVQEEFVDAEVRYRVRLARRGRRTIPARIWQALDPETPRAQPGPREEHLALQRVREILSSRPTRFLVCTTPVVLILLAAEWLVATNNQSFTGVLNLGGVLAAPVFAGIFPVLLLASSRRKGSLVPQGYYRFIGHPVVLVALYLIFISSLLAHGLLIWQAPFERSAALFTGLLVLGMTFLAIRGGAFRPRVVVELRRIAQGLAHFAVVERGTLAPADVCLQYRDHETRLRASGGEIPELSSVCGVSFEMDTRAHELQVWAHQVSPDGHSTPLPAHLTISSENSQTRGSYDLQLNGGQVLIPFHSNRCRVELAIESAPTLRPSKQNLPSSRLG